VIEGDPPAKRTLRYVAEPRSELFDLQADPGERQNLAERLPEKVAEMRQLCEAWMKETGAKDVTPNPAYDPKNPLFNAREDYLEKHAEKKK
jgi:hypothetical protein